MDTKKLLDFIEKAQDQAKALDAFVEEQRAVSVAVRSRDWPSLEKALQKAELAADGVAAAEDRRGEAWSGFLSSAGLPADATVFRASLAAPMEYRTLLTDVYRTLRLSAMRARIENESLSDFVGASASSLSLAVETLFPERRGRIYGRTGKPAKAAHGALVLDKAF